jgi:putative transposase
VPLKRRDLKREGKAFRFAGNTFRVFPEGRIRDGTGFAQDARGNRFLNIVIEVVDVCARPIRTGVGVDPGLKDFAVLSTGEKLPNDRFGRAAAGKLAIAQRARKPAPPERVFLRVVAEVPDVIDRTAVLPKQAVERFHTQ